MSFALFDKGVLKFGPGELDKFRELDDESFAKGVFGADFVEDALPLLPSFTDVETFGFGLLEPKLPLGVVVVGPFVNQLLSVF